jgi:hypothetical protein
MEYENLAALQLSAFDKRIRREAFLPIDLHVQIRGCQRISNMVCCYPPNTRLQLQGHACIYYEAAPSMSPTSLQCFLWSFAKHLEKRKVN